MVVCASTSAAKTVTAVKTTTPVKSTASVKKVTTPVKVVPPPCIIKVTSAAAINDPRVPGCSYEIIAPPKPVVTQPKASATSATTISSATDQAAFTPNPVGISSSASSGLVGQSFFFGAVAGAHTRSALILGQPAQVEFNPISFEWYADDGSSGSGTSFAASWLAEGSHSVSLTVGYAVSYSLAGGWNDAGVISSAASAVVSVGSIPQAVVTRPVTPVLVSGNCHVRPGSYRC